MKITIGEIRKIIREVGTAAKKKPLAAAGGDDLKSAVDKLFDVIETIDVKEEKEGFVGGILLNAFRKTGMFSWGGPGHLAAYRIEQSIHYKKLKLSRSTFLSDLLKSMAEYKSKNPKSAPDLDALMTKTIVAVTKSVSAGTKKLASAPGGEDSSASLGRFAFADGHGRMTDAPKVPFEPNTKIEDKIYNAIVDYVERIDQPDPAVALAMRDVLQGDMYKDIFVEPTAELVYRGQAVDETDLRKILGLAPEDPLPSSGSEDIEILYKWSPRRAFVSWTRSMRVAQGFTTGNDYAVVMTAAVADNPKVFLNGADGLYRLNIHKRFRKEDEVLAVGPVKVSHVEWRLIAGDGGRILQKKKK